MVPTVKQDGDEQMKRAMTNSVLAQETASFQNSGGVSAENRSFGFHPAFMDAETERVFASSFADGRRAPFHLLDGLPNDVVLERNAAGRVVAVKSSVIAGFVHQGRFYTRDEAARYVSSMAACVS